MKVLFLTLLVAALSGGIASAGGNCVGNNSEACRNARAAFAEHHGGAYPNQWFQGHQGRWARNGNNWRWRSNDGGEYWRGNHGWSWREAHEHHHHHHDHDDD